MKYSQQCVEFKNEISNKDREIQFYKEELEKVREQKDDKDTIARSALENSNVYLKTQLSEKNHKIASLEKDLAAANHRLILSGIDDLEELQQEMRKMNEVYEQEVENYKAEISHCRSENESQRKQLEDLQNFVNIVQRLATIQSREEVIDFCMILLIL